MGVCKNKMLTVEEAAAVIGLKSKSQALHYLGKPPADCITKVRGATSYKFPASYVTKVAAEYKERLKCRTCSKPCVCYLCQNKNVYRKGLCASCDIEQTCIDNCERVIDNGGKKKDCICALERAIQKLTRQLR